MSRKGYHLLTQQLSNSDPDEENNRNLFESKELNVMDDGWSDVKENLDIFVNDAAHPKQNTHLELRARNSYGGGMKSIDQDIDSSPPDSGNRRGNGAVLLERRVRKQDTLQKLSLQFGVSVAELKRVNGFISDTDLFARDIIKIPVQKYASNYMLLMAELEMDQSSASSNAPGPSFVAGQSPLDPPTCTSNDENPLQAQELLRAVDANVLKAQRQLEQRQQSSDVFNATNGFDDDGMLDVVQQMGGYRSRNNHQWLERSIRHYLAIVLILFVVIGFPVLYFLYKFSESHGHSNENTNNHSHDKG